jgi:hypothetical protein
MESKEEEEEVFRALGFLIVRTEFLYLNHLMN